MSRKRKILVPEAEQSLNHLKSEVMQKEGFYANSPELIKYEVAKHLDVPLTKGDNGDITAKQAGKVGGKIGGSMVKELINLAQESLRKNPGK